MMTATYNLDTAVGRLQLTIVDTSTAATAFTDSESEAIQARYDRLPDVRR